MCLFFIPFTQWADTEQLIWPDVSGHLVNVGPPFSFLLALFWSPPTLAAKFSTVFNSLWLMPSVCRLVVCQCFPQVKNLPVVVGGLWQLAMRQPGMWWQWFASIISTIMHIIILFKIIQLCFQWHNVGDNSWFFPGRGGPDPNIRPWASPTTPVS